MNTLHYGQKQHLQTKMEAWSNDTYERVPFTCDKNLTDQNVRARISTALYKRFPPHHYAGMGYSCTVNEFHRVAPDSGYVVLVHYQGIGD